jgi:UDP-N-acetylglucosamine--N-acetylmuramyl-(pentapeptide) pyrophosphoryl-undecaprenol N-acetylglucosamine transferase
MGRGVQGVLGLMKLPGAIARSAAIIRRFRPDVILGVGGYSSGPVIVAGRMFFRIPCAIQEQNAIPGLTNRVLGRLLGGLVQRAFVSFEPTLNQFGAKAVLAGNPVRRVLQGPRVRTDAPGPGLFIFGGSQGAHSINKAVVAMLPYLSDMAGTLRAVHQTGETDRDDVARAWHEAGFKEARVEAFIVDMAAVYASADIVISRSGATTLAELCAQGLPSVLVPYPFAANNHQEHNARALERAGAAEVILDRDLSGGLLAERVRALLSDPARLARMGAAARSLARPDAAKTIADGLTRLANR